MSEPGTTRGHAPISHRLGLDEIVTAFERQLDLEASIKVMVGP